MKSVVVTGANGFVGSHLIKELSKHDIAIIAVIKDHEENIENIKDTPNLSIVYCEMDDIKTLPEKIEGEFDTFYHLAWAGSTGNARADYGLQLTNVRWACDAVNAAAGLKCKKFIGVGTLAEFDVNAYAPLPGSTPNAVSCYGTAKIAMHYMTKAECSRLGVQHLWAYLSNNFGEGNYTGNFINFASKLMLTGQPANFTSGEQPYDFVYIDDTARGLYFIGENGKANTPYYIGSNHSRQLKDFIRILRDTIDPSIELHLGAVPFNGVMQPESVFDCSRLVEDTGYEPSYTFEDAITKTVHWIDEQIKEGKL